MQRHRVLLLVPLLLAGLPSCSEPAPDASDEPASPVPDTPQPVMSGLVGSITTLLPLTLREGGLADPGNERAVRGSFDTLARHAELLREYAWGEDAGFSSLARTLAEDIAAADRAYQEGRLSQAGFRIQRLVPDCVSCHSRLPATRDSDLGGTLLKALHPANLRPDELAQLQVATRQFEAAAVSYEALLGQAEAPGLSGMGPLSDYLVLCLRVLGTPARTLPTLDRWLGDPGLPVKLRADLTRWRGAILALPEATPGPSASKEELLTAARQHSKAAASTEAAGQSALVSWIAASALLHRVVEGEQGHEPALAEAYVLLGQAEARLGTSPWLSQPDVYFATAIRTAPKGPFAQQAMAQLELWTAVQYSGSGGEHIPPEVQRELDALRALMGQTEAPAPR